MSLSAVIVTLPYPPTANLIWRRAGARTIRSPKYDAWRAECTLIIRAETRGKGLVGPYAMTLQIGKPDRRRRDLDNVIKPCGDVLVLAGAVADDSDCQDIAARWCPDVIGVRITVLETKLIPPSQAAARSGCAGDGEAAAVASPELT